MAEISKHFKTRAPSAIRLASIEFAKREEGVEAINVAIGNVSLPMYPAMLKRMNSIGERGSPFSDGAVKYTATRGEREANEAVLNVIASSGFSTNGLYSQILDGGSMGMELVIVGCCGGAGSSEAPLLLIDAAYTNYMLFAQRVGRKTVSVKRTLGEDGKFSLPKIEEIEEEIKKSHPGAMVIIPYDNPTGQFFSHERMVELAQLCVKYDMWVISDEAYMELHYTGEMPSSIWGIDDKIVPGIEGRRISIETASKVWNACGLRIGALVTDNKEFHEKSVAEYTANLCPNAIGQYIFGALAHESHENLQKWYEKQRQYYKKMMLDVSSRLQKRLSGVIVSSPDASMYSVVDVSKICNEKFDATEFVMYCAREGSVEVNGKKMTLLVAPMEGFYSVIDGEENPGKKQMRIAYVETPEKMGLVPELFAKLFEEYEKRKN